MVEHDHRGIKNSTKYTLGFKSFEATEQLLPELSCIECLKKDRWKWLGICRLGNNFMSLQHNYDLNKGAPAFYKIFDRTSLGASLQ